MIGHELAYGLQSFVPLFSVYSLSKTYLEALTHLLTLGMIDPFAYAGGKVARECSMISAAFVK